MSWMKSGTHKCTIKDANFQKIGQKGTEAIVVEFENEAGETIKWTGFLTEKAAEKTWNKLAEMGFNDDNPFKNTDGSIFYKANHFSVKSFEIIVEDEPAYNDPSKTYAKVKWINVPRGNNFNKAAPTTVTPPLNIKNSLAAARARMGVKKVENPGTGDNDPLPF